MNAHWCALKHFEFWWSNGYYRQPYWLSFGYDEHWFALPNTVFGGATVLDSIGKSKQPYFTNKKLGSFGEIGNKSNMKSMSYQRQF